MNRPRRDETMERQAGISLDRAPLLAGIERRRLIRTSPIPLIG
jgi:hypothetical protein